MFSQTGIQGRSPPKVSVATVHLSRKRVLTHGLHLDREPDFNSWMAISDPGCWTRFGLQRSHPILGGCAPCNDCFQRNISWILSDPYWPCAQFAEAPYRCEAAQRARGKVLS